MQLLKANISKLAVETFVGEPNIFPLISEGHHLQVFTFSKSISLSNQPRCLLLLNAAFEILSLLSLGLDVLHQSVVVSLFLCSPSTFELSYRELECDRGPGPQLPEVEKQHY